MLNNNLFVNSNVIDSGQFIKSWQILDKNLENVSPIKGEWNIFKHPPPPGNRPKVHNEFEKNEDDVVDDNVAHNRE